MILTLLWIGVCVLFIVAVLEIGWPHVIREGFESVIPMIPSGVSMCPVEAILAPTLI